MIELKPCPFCGADYFKKTDKQIIDGDSCTCIFDGSYYFITHKPNCFLSLYEDDSKMFIDTSDIKAWNRRAVAPKEKREGE